MTAPLRICVIGAGAIGGFLGVHLTGGGADLSVVARGATLAALRRDGWTLESGGERRVVPVRAVADARELDVQDVVIVAVKAHALGEVAEAVQALRGPATLVVPALNGVPRWFTDPSAGLPLQGPLASTDPDGRIASRIPASAVIGAIVYAACSTPAPGVTRHDAGTRVVLGEAAGPAGGAISERLARLAATLQAAGLAAEASSDIRTEVWQKLLGNACFNPVSYLTAAVTDVLIDDPATHALCLAMMAETLAVGRAIGIDAAIEPDARLAITRRLGSVKTSMLQDAEAGKAIEIDAILGAVIEIARCMAVAVPVSDTVYALARLRAKAAGLHKG